MQLRQLGRSTLEIAPLSLGGNVFGGTIDEPTSFAVLDAYVEGVAIVSTPLIAIRPGFRAAAPASPKRSWGAG